MTDPNVPPVEAPPAELPPAAEGPALEMVVDPEKEQLRQRAELLEQTNQQLASMAQAIRPAGPGVEDDPAVREFQQALVDPTHYGHAIASVSARSLQAMNEKVDKLSRQLEQTQAETAAMASIPAAHHDAVRKYVKDNPGEFGTYGAAYKAMKGEGIIKAAPEEVRRTDEQLLAQRASGATTLPPSSPPPRPLTKEVMTRAEYMRNLTPDLRNKADKGEVIIQD